MRSQAQGKERDECIGGQLKAADAQAKCDPNAIQEVALPVEKIWSDLETARLGNFLPERQVEFKASTVHR